jgi:hypothetical protein
VFLVLFVAIVQAMQPHLFENQSLNVVKPSGRLPQYLADAGSAGTKKRKPGRTGLPRNYLISNEFEIRKSYFLAAFLATFFVAFFAAFFTAFLTTFLVAFLAAFLATFFLVAMCESPPSGWVQFKKGMGERILRRAWNARIHWLKRMSCRSLRTPRP